MPLEIHIQTLDIASLEARMQAMARPAYSAVAAHARGGKPAILFVPTRKHARLTALDLLTYAAADGPAQALPAGGRMLEPSGEGDYSEVHLPADKCSPCQGADQV